jgi:hypothetical protein
LRRALCFVRLHLTSTAPQELQLKPKTPLRYAGWLAALALGACAPMAPSTPQGRMTFFVTSVSPGKGADLGGLAGADAHCQALAAAAGVGKRTWHAYLSTTDRGQALVNARDRIGSGPWQNIKGDVIATSVDDLHSNNNKLTKQTALTEKGDIVSGRGDPVNTHDMLTGSQPDGRAIAGNVDTSCGNWTSSGNGAAMLGHSDRTGLDDSVPAKSWNSSHQSRGCGMEALKSTGGAGLMYCFAVN